MSARPICGGLPTRRRSLASGPCQRRAEHKGMHRDVHGEKFRWASPGTASVFSEPMADIGEALRALTIEVVEPRLVRLESRHVEAIKRSLGKTIQDVEYMGWSSELAEDFKEALEAISCGDGL